MGRVNWKGPFVEKSILKKKPITWSRKSVILPFLLGHSISVHNGNKFIKIKITEDMIGHKLGEFIPTRVKFFYKQTKNK